LDQRTLRYPYFLPHASIFVTGRGGIRSNVTIAVSEDGTEIHAFGNRSSFPAMEINATVGTQTFAIYRGVAPSTPLGFGIFGTTTFNRQCGSTTTHTGVTNEKPSGSMASALPAIALGRLSGVLQPKAEGNLRDPGRISRVDSDLHATSKMFAVAEESGWGNRIPHQPRRHAMYEHPARGGVGTS
jgi:hypothetical protein